MDLTPYRKIRATCRADISRLSTAVKLILHGKHREAVAQHNDNSEEHSDKNSPFNEGDHETREVGLLNGHRIVEREGS